MCSLGIGNSVESAENRHPRRRSRRRQAVLLINLGAPDTPDVSSVRRYLAEVFSDPAVNGLPRYLGWLSPLWSRGRASSTVARVARDNQSVWTDEGPPLHAITRQQASALESKLPGGMRVYCAMRYGRPGIGEVLRRIVEAGVEQLTVLPMYPQYSSFTSQTTVRELYRQAERFGSGLDITMRSIWYDDTGYINAQARRIHEYAIAHGLTPENTCLVYSGRSLPTSYIGRGDSYVDQICRTVELVGNRLGWPADRAKLGYQGQPSPTGWLAPTTVEVLSALSGSGEKQVLVCPLGFATDSVETLAEIHIQYRERFEQKGGRLFACPALNAFEPFIAALRNLVLHGRYPVAGQGGTTSLFPSGSASEDTEQGLDSCLDSLVMVGMSRRGRLGRGQGPDVEHADVGDFRRIKNPQCHVPEVLRSVCESGSVREALLWNTCRRIELYGWLDETTNEAARAETISDLRSRLFGANCGPAGPHVNVLRGADAWHHLMRTAAGLNSGLPGEREVLQQLHGARRLAERAGTVGPLTERLVAEISENERHLRGNTDWGRFGPDYCYAAISQIVRSSELDLERGKCLIIGGSTTSCAIIEVLAEHFGVPRRRMTLLHRGHGHGGHLKMLRRAIGSGRRIRVNKYDDRSVMRAIARADVVFFGLDRRDSVLNAEQVRGCRD